MSRASFASCCHPVPFATALAAILLVGACRSTPAAPPAPVVSADAWAVVDGREIKRDDVEKAFRRMSDPAQSLSDEEALTARLALLNDLIVEDILMAKARALKVEIPESDLDKAYTEAQKNVPADVFQQELTRRNVTATDMREGLRRQLLVQRLIDQEVGSKITVSDQEITDFFNVNRSQFDLPEDAYRIAQIVITPVREQQLANRTGDDATTPEAANQKVAMLMEKLKQGAAFTDLAMDYSEDPESAPRGGDLGLMPLSALKQAPPALRDAVLKVTPGSARVVSQGGAHTIVYVVAKEAAGRRDLSTPGVREGITATLKNRKEQLLRSAYLAAAREDADVTNYMARKIVASGGKPQP